MIDCSYADYNKKKKKMISNHTSIKFSLMLEFQRNNMYIRTT